MSPLPGDLKELAEHRGPQIPEPGEFYDIRIVADRTGLGLAEQFPETRQVEDGRKRLVHPPQLLDSGKRPVVPSAVADCPIGAHGEHGTGCATPIRGQSRIPLQEVEIGVRGEEGVAACLEPTCLPRGLAEHVGRQSESNLRLHERPS